jgi:hypothetical protein
MGLMLRNTRGQPSPGCGQYTRTTTRRVPESATGVVSAMWMLAGYGGIPPPCVNRMEGWLFAFLSMPIFTPLTSITKSIATPTSPPWRDLKEIRC